MTYATKTEAEAAALNVPCGAAVWVGPTMVKFHGVSKAGWYVIALGKVR
jgi:hypothetical protein